MTCKNCGEELESDWNICPHCGFLAVPNSEGTAITGFARHSKGKQLWIVLAVLKICAIAGLILFGAAILATAECFRNMPG